MSATTGRRTMVAEVREVLSRAALRDGLHQGTKERPASEVLARLRESAHVLLDQVFDEHMATAEAIEPTAEFEPALTYEELRLFFFGHACRCPGDDS